MILNDNYDIEAAVSVQNIGFVAELITRAILLILRQGDGNLLSLNSSTKGKDNVK